MANQIVLRHLLTLESDTLPKSKHYREIVGKFSERAHANNLHVDHIADMMGDKLSIELSHIISATAEDAEIARVKSLFARTWSGSHTLTFGEYVAARSKKQLRPGLNVPISTFDETPNERTEPQPIKMECFKSNALVGCIAKALHMYDPESLAELANEVLRLPEGVIVEHVGRDEFQAPEGVLGL